MAATDKPACSALGALLAAAAALPLTTTPLRAGQIEEIRAGINHFSYREKDGRMAVNAPQAWMQGAVARDLDLDARVTLDAVSGASPQLVTNQSGRPVHTLSSASIRELRREAALRATRWLGDDSVSFGAAVSSEHDYLSQALDIGARMDFLDKNVTIALGAAVSNDHISATGLPGIEGTRRTRHLFAGLTQVLTPTDIVQSNLAYGSGHGYYDDPYKSTVTFLGPLARLPVLRTDTRPDSRRILAWLTRWRRYFPAQSAALGVDYRYFRDSWDIRSHTIEASWHQNLGQQWALKPALRWYGQSAAFFYAPTFNTRNGLGSSDARLGAFGALTLSMTLSAQLGEYGTLELGAGRYAQRASWRPGGGSPELPAFDANYLTIGWTRTF